MAQNAFILTSRLQGAAREAQEVLGEEQVLVGAQVARLPRSLLAKQVAEISVRPDYLRDSDEKNHCQSLSKVVRLLEKCTKGYIPDFSLTDATKLLAT